VQLDGVAATIDCAGREVSLHRDRQHFVGQLPLGVRDDAGRLATVVCFGRLPRATTDIAFYRGEQRLKSFLGDQEVPWLDQTRRLYEALFHALSGQVVRRKPRPPSRKVSVRRVLGLLGKVAVEVKEQIADGLSDEPPVTLRRHDPGEPSPAVGPGEDKYPRDGQQR
jgi:hypothetical protein